MLTTFPILRSEEVVFNQQFELRVGYLSLLKHFLWKRFYDFIAEAAKAFQPYFEVLQDRFAKRPCYADLVFCL